MTNAHHTSKIHESISDMEKKDAMKFFWQKVEWTDPLTLCEQLRTQKRSPLLFYSGITVPEVNGGRFSFLPFDPVKTIEYNMSEEHTDILQILRSHLGDYRTVPKDAPAPFHYFCGGLSGYMSYELGHQFETFEWPEKTNEHIPTALFFLFETLFAFDHTNNTCFWGTWHHSPQQAEEKFAQLQTMINASQSRSQEIKEKELAHTSSSEFVPEITKDQYSHAIESIKHELVAGNSYQVNFSQKWSAQRSKDNFQLFRTLADKNPAPMMCFLEHGDISILSCTPERLFSLSDRRIFAQPIKGTRPRGNNEMEEQEIITDLLSDEKESAEHLMIVDLIRNDFGRVAQAGTVRVTDLMRVEKYKTVIHLVSDITATLDQQYDALDVVRAMFPGGSITGAPKIATMNIISELEKSTRGAYCGSAGYISFNGNADFNILIRTVQKYGNQLEVRAGGGIVMDSSAGPEYAESIQKVRGITENL